ncbi:MAG TPA: hypothetical protein VFE08_01675, partial [Candidatus Sulfotelmatobacter sp.]|nr:hypothetical protein [Candidatus Sulfotelmatobacter sp.]
ASAWTAGFERVLNPWADPSGPGSYGDRLWFRFFSGLISYLILYVAILGVGYALESRDRLARQQTRPHGSANNSRALNWTLCGDRSSLTFFLIV